jgi:hypothetical protein
MTVANDDVSPPRQSRRHERRERRRALRFSTVLRQVADGEGEWVSIGEFARVFGPRSFGALMFILAVPNLLPLPPGSSAVFGAPLMFIAAQLAFGRSVLWLPRVIRDRSIKRTTLKFVVDRILQRLRWVERLLAPRLSAFFTLPGTILIGLLCLAMAFILFLPIPGANLLPGLSISLFSLALLQRDGYAALAGLVAALATLAVVVAIGGTVWLSVKALLSHLNPLK